MVEIGVRSKANFISNRILNSEQSVLIQVNGDSWANEQCFLNIFTHETPKKSKYVETPFMKRFMSWTPYLNQWTLPLNKIKKGVIQEK